MEISDVIVIGAGLAGLTAAHRLHLNGVSVVVLEASDRVGGRTRSETIGATTVDFGAEWLGPKHTRLRTLIHELGLSTEPARMLGRPILWRSTNGTRLARSLSIKNDVAGAKVLWRARRLARRLDPQRPWSNPHAATLDQTSFGNWLRDNGARGDLYRYLSAVVSMLTGTPVDDLSLLQVLWWFARGGGPVATVYTTFASRVTGGTQSIALALAAALGNRVQVDRAVDRIVHDDNGVTVHTLGGDTYRGQRAIITGALDTKAPIAVIPPLPEQFSVLDDLRIPPGVKVTAVLPEGHRCRHVLAIGGTPLGGAWRNGRRVTGFAMTGHEDAADDELIADLGACYNVDPNKLHGPQIYRWSTHPAIGGCDIGFAPGQLTTCGPHLSTGHGRIDFAGAERSTWPNNMEGAVESGINAAANAASNLATRR
jgi:monoamine oxidase